jgi:hypothetical protein
MSTTSNTKDLVPNPKCAAQIHKRRSSIALRNDEPPSKILRHKSDEAALCARCTALDFSKIFKTRVMRNLGEFVLDIESLDELKVSDCRFCALLATMFPRSFDESNSMVDGECHVRAFSINRTYAGPNWKSFLKNDSTILGVVCINKASAKSGKGDALSKMTCSLDETGYIGMEQDSQPAESFGIRRLVSTSFDEMFAKDSISYCLSNHGQACNSLERPVFENLRPSAFSFRVIDCVSGRVTNAVLDCTYVALSYLWGTEPSKSAIFASSTDQPMLPDDCPRVIRDSIDVTLKLGCKYLWVDRYCINQLDEIDQKTQVSQMDRIYFNAHITIIAAAGKDPDHGLPGVNQKNRQRQPVAKIGNRTLISSLPRSRWSIHHSTWASRGWTFQEGFLSKRRLIFTDQQIFFECNTMACAEAIVQPLDAIHCKDKQHNGQRELRAGIPPSAFGHKIPGGVPIDIISHLSDYTQRELTYPSDALNAFQGVFHIFSRRDEPVNHLLGVPMLPPVPIRKTNQLVAFNRSTSDSCVVGLSWSHKAPGKRRVEFPSWSWAGWEGQLEASLLWSKHWEESRFHTIIQSVECGEGDHRLFPSNHTDFPLRLSKMPTPVKYIHISAVVFPGQLVWIDRAKDLREDEQDSKGVPQSNGYFIKVELRRPGKAYVYTPACLDGPPEELLGEPLLCVSFHAHPLLTPESVVEEHDLMLVQDRGSHFERVGFTAFHHGYVKTPEGLWAGKAKWHYDGPLIQHLGDRMIRLG